MDAYDIIFKMMDLWREHADRNTYQQRLERLEIVVDTNEGYRNIIGLKWNSELHKIELILDEE